MSLDKKLKDHYLKQSLRKEVADQLLLYKKKSTILDPLEKEHITNSINNNRSWSYAFSIAALFVLAFVFVFTLYEKNQFMQVVAKEMLKNHNKNEPSDYVVKNYLQIAQYLPELNFSLATNLNDQKKYLANLEPVGTRYCSIQGEPAAQIRMRNTDSKKRATLYIGSMPRLWFGFLIEEFQYTKKNVVVFIWKDQDRLFGLVQEMRN